MNFTLDPQVESYLNHNLQLIDEEDFEGLYKNFPNPKRFWTEIANMTAALYLAGIDPLESSNKVFSCMFHSFPSGILPSSYILPRQIESIEDWAFKYSMFEELIFPQALTKIHDAAFRGMEKLKSVVFNPHSKIEYIGVDAFKGTTNIQNFIMPKSCKKIDVEAFAYCGGLDTHLKLSEDLEILGKGAFFKTKIETVEFGPNLRIISGHPLYGCDNLKEIIIPRASFDRVRGNVKEILTDGNNAKVIVV